MEEIGQLVAGLEQLVRAYGAAAVFVVVMLEAFGVPLPGESILIFSAVLAGRGEMSLPALLICAWAGAVVGDNIGYLIGRTLGRAAVARFGARIGLTEARFEWIESLFARFGAFKGGTFWSFKGELAGGDSNADNFIEAVHGTVYTEVRTFADGAIETEDKR